MKLDYEFKNRDLLNTALSHSSYINEHKGLECNERLEFLGDSILGFVTAEYLYKNYPNLPEGNLTKIRANVVCETMLAKLGKEIGLNCDLLLGKGEEHTGGRERSSIIADAMEAVIGAIYLDGGIEPAKSFILNMLIPEIKATVSTPRVLDSKTSLQEILQKDSSAVIEYDIINESGPAHNKIFEASVSCNGKILGKGKGKSKKEAEQDAAMNAIENINK
ncbi:MAG: ribonuclease III [Lachnospirales bacterium]